MKGVFCMYRTVEDFTKDWSQNAQGTLNAIRAISDDKLHFAIVEGHSSLGWLAWHLTTAPGFFGNMLAGLGLEVQFDPNAQPATVEEIAVAYEKVMADVSAKVAALSDEDMLAEVKGIHGPAPRGAILRAMIDHQTHHLGQMTVLLRQAGLTVPPVMGPTKEMQAK